MEPRFISLYMDIAKRTAEMSRAVRLKAGCIVVKDDRIISLSWNGTPAKWDNCCENKEYVTEETPGYPIYTDEHGKYRLVTKPEVLHAERNALDKLARSHESGLGATLIVTHSPCLECAKSIYGAGIKEVIYNTEYRSSDGIKFLQECNVLVRKFDDIRIC